MKPLKPSIFWFITILATSAVHAQQAFQNLNFEKANPIIDPGGQFYPNDVTAASALPGWTVYLGTVQQADVLQNEYTTGQASVDIFGPNYPAAGSPPTLFNAGTIDGNYSVLLEAGNPPFSPTFVGASIAQTGSVPPLAESLEFKAWTLPGTEFGVSFNGNNLSPVALGSGPNYTLYAVNIASYEGQTGSLEFTADFSGEGASWLGLDDIAFSQTSVVPEPNIVSLSMIGGLLFGARKWLARR